MKYKRNIKGNELRKIDGRYESRYFHDSEFIMQELNKVSPSFCLAKWYNVSIHIPTGRTHSCYHPKSHHIPLDELADNPGALHNTKYKKEQRKMMLNGIRPEECEFCWQTEDSGDQLSDRAYRSKDVYEHGLIEHSQIDDDPNPRYLEVNFNQACNFRCSYCGPQLSTAWQREVENNGPYILTDRWHNDANWVKNKIKPDNSPNNPYLHAFWKWFPTVYPTLQTFRMTGGEPLMDKNTFSIFDYVKQNPKEDLHLSLTSNCCPPGDQWQKFMTSLKEITDRDAVDHFMLFCSLDSWGPQAEYIRNGLDFKMLYNNVTDYLANSSKHSLTFIITFNTLSYPGFLTYIQHILKLRQQYSTDRQLIWFDVPQLMEPEYMNPKLMPELTTELDKTIEFMESNKDTEHTEFKGFSDFEISKIRRLKDWILNDADFDRTKAQQNFVMFWEQHDERMGTDFLQTFPELEDYWNKFRNING